MSQPEARKNRARGLRVLRPGGKVCIMEIGRPSNRLLRGVLWFRISVMVPVLARLNGRLADVKRLMAHHRDTIETALDPDTILKALRRVGFADVGGSVSLGIVREYTGTQP